MKPAKVARVSVMAFWKLSTADSFMMHAKTMTRMIYKNIYQGGVKHVCVIHWW
jgi:hypothetical protein